MPATAHGHLTTFVKGEVQPSTSKRHSPDIFCAVEFGSPLSPLLPSILLDEVGSFEAS
jgi:hypothetical protein